MPRNWRGVAERGDKVRSRDWGRGRGTSEGERPVKLEDRGQDGKRQTLSELQLTAQSLVHELITFGHMLCSVEKNAFCTLNVSMLAPKPGVSQEQFQDPAMPLVFWARV